MKQYTCAVCGYDQLTQPPDDYTICPSCGTEFGYTDFNTSHDELRREWMLGGMKWHSRLIQSPPQWDRYKQLLNLHNAVENSARETQITEVSVVEMGKDVSIVEGYKSQSRWYGFGNWHPQKRTKSTFIIEAHA